MLLAGVFGQQGVAFLLSNQGLALAVGALTTVHLLHQR